MAQWLWISLHECRRFKAQWCVVNRVLGRAYSKEANCDSSHFVDFYRIVDYCDHVNFRINQHKIQALHLGQLKIKYLLNNNYLFRPECQKLLDMFYSNLSFYKYKALKTCKLKDDNGNKWKKKNVMVWHLFKILVFTM